MSNFYLGKDSENNKFFYNGNHLLTHAAILGMTGSGKTGLCIGLIEESILNGVSSIIIDPKGDLSNLLLHFPEMSREDFFNWSENPDESYQLWSEGLKEWDLTPEMVYNLKKADYNVFTPASDAGKKISILSSFDAGMTWQGNEKILRDKISNLVSAILSLVGYKENNMLQKEHVFLSNLFEYTWAKNESFNLFELVVRIMNPPFKNIGAFSVDVVFPFDERQRFAVTLNNIISSPNFKNWSDGEPLNINNLLNGDNPKVNIFSINHLSDDDRMFFLTMFLSAYESWMFSQSGKKQLKSILYIDEVAGYLPPVKNPSCKPSLMRLLKQARAFGVGIVLATQNPIDIDYKALSNVGTWFVGKLQTERDKKRLADGLKSAGLNDYSAIISSLKKREFLVHNINESPKVFSTRWTINYLAGPLDREQIKMLNQNNTYYNEESPIGETGKTRPFVNGYKEYFIPGKKNDTYIPKVFIRVSVGYSYKPSNLIGKFEKFLVGYSSENFTEFNLSEGLSNNPVEGYFKNIPVNMDDKNIKRIKARFIEWIINNINPSILTNKVLGLTSYVDTPLSNFHKVCKDTAEEKGIQFNIKQVEKIMIEISKRNIEIKEFGIIWLPESLDMKQCFMVKQIITKQKRTNKKMNTRNQKVEENQIWESIFYHGEVRLIIHKVLPKEDIVEAYSCDVNSSCGGQIRTYFLSTFHDCYKLVEE